MSRRSESLKATWAAGATVLVVGVFVTGCGSSAAPTGGRPAVGATPAPSTPDTGSHGSTPSQTAEANGKPLVAPCAVLSRHDVSVAFGAPAPAGSVGSGGQYTCVYTSGTHGLEVTPSVARPGSKSDAKASVVADVDGQPVPQAQITVLKGSASIYIVLTDDAKPNGVSLVKPATVLGKDAARGL
jgi:hypothetical protein